jgi:hypothetical protein
MKTDGEHASKSQPETDVVFELRFKRVHNIVDRGVEMFVSVQKIAVKLHTIGTTFPFNPKFDTWLRDLLQLLVANKGHFSRMSGKGLSCEHRKIAPL